MAGRRANGEGTIYREGNGRWRAAITLTSGKRKFFRGRTRQEVAQKLNSATRTREDGMPLPSDQLTVSQHLRHWLESAKPSLRPSTHRRYEQLIRLQIVPFIGKLPLARLKPGHLQRLYSQRLDAGQSPSSVRQAHAVLHKALKQATRWGSVARSVADLVSPPKVEKREMKTLSPDQARHFLEAGTDDRLDALYVLALSTGMRQGELLALHWDDVDLDAGRLSVTRTLQRTSTGHVFGNPKTSHSRRQIQLTNIAIRALKRHRAAQNSERLLLSDAWQDQGLVFTDRIGGFLKSWNVRRQFLELLERAGLPRIRFHELRHTAASLMMARNIHPKIVSEMLGHSQISITLDLYSHVTPTMQQAATDALDDILSA